jgi:hypothetical protein
MKVVIVMISFGQIWLWNATDDKKTYTSVSNCVCLWLSSLVLVLLQLGIPVILFYESEALSGECIEKYAGEYSSLRNHIILTYAQNNILS